MKNTSSKSQPAATTAARLLQLLAAALFSVVAAAPAAADTQPTLAEAVRARSAGTQVDPRVQPEESAPEAASADLAATWGVEIASIRLTANEHMIDYRYKVVDAAKAADLFKRQIKPQLIHQETGRVLVVPDTAKVGPLRNSNTPKEGKIYWMFFGNAEQLVKAGDTVTVVIGDYVVENLVVE
jgi:hypothetical protein